MTNFNNYFKQLEKPNSFVTLFFGDSASGKTFTSMSYPTPIYIIDTENRAINTKYYNYNDKDIKIFEPVDFKTKFNEKENDSFDSYTTIENINKFIIDFANEVKEGRITKGTLVIDSVTDIWSFVQDWGTIELGKRITNKGIKRADEITGELNSQFDWKVPNKKHYEMLGILRSLIKHGIYVVFTAREREIPDYVVQTKPRTLKDVIRSQRDVPFLADIIINLRRENTKYMANLIKLNALPIKEEKIENIDFEKIMGLIKKYEELVKNGSKQQGISGMVKQNNIK